jgi:hypothetical protein
MRLLTVENVGEGMDILLRVKGTRLFKQVAKVVGEHEAYEELVRVAFWRCETGRGDVSTVLADNLITAFNWESSPQGRTYWENINDNRED